MRRALALLALASGLALAGGGGGPALTGLPTPTFMGKAVLTALAVDGTGVPVLAWTALSSAQHTQLHAARFTGGRWTPLGGVLNAGPAFNATQLTARTAPDGRVWLGWAEDSGEAHVDSYLLSVWDGRAWSDPERYVLRRDLSDAGRSRSFDVRPSGAPLLAWTDLDYRPAPDAPRVAGNVVRPFMWTGQTWWRDRPLSVPGRYAFAPSLRLGPDGSGAVTFLEGDAATSDVRVQQRRADGTWAPLGGPLNRRAHSYAAAPTLALAPGGRPVLAWLEGEGDLDRLQVSRWTGTVWQPLGSSVSTPGVSAEAPALGVTRNGQPVLAWLEAGHLRAARWTGTAWQSFSLPATHEASGPSLSPDGTYLAVSDGGRVGVWRLP